MPHDAAAMLDLYYTIYFQMTNGYCGSFTVEEIIQNTKECVCSIARANNITYEQAMSEFNVVAARRENEIMAHAERIANLPKTHRCPTYLNIKEMAKFAIEIPPFTDMEKIIFKKRSNIDRAWHKIEQLLSKYIIQKDRQ